MIFLVALILNLRYPLLMLAPHPEVISQFLVDTLRSWVTVNRAALTVRYTAIQPPSAAPPWYPETSAALDALRTKAEAWTTAVSADVFAGVPQALIDYADLFAASMTPLGGSDAKQILEVLQQLTDEAQEKYEQVTALSAKLHDFIGVLSASREGVERALGDALATIRADKALANAIADRINTIMVEVGGESVDASNSQFSAGSSAASLVGTAMAFSLESALLMGPTSPLLSLAIAAIGITYAAISSGEKFDKAREGLAEIATLRGQLLDEQQQIVVLRLLVNGMRNIEETVDRIGPALSMAPVWEDTVTELKLAIAQVNAGIAPASLTELATVTSAATRWDRIRTMATNVQASISGMTFEAPVELKPS
jgi:hypothetical protein